MASDDDFKLGRELAKAQNQFNLQWQANNQPPPLEIPPPPLVLQSLEINSNNDKRQRRKPVRFLQDEATVPSKKRDLTTVLTSSSSTTTTTATSKKDGRGRKPRNIPHMYDTKEKIDELERDRNEFIHLRDVLQKKISVATFLVGKPHSKGNFSAYVAKDENKRRALPTLDNGRHGLAEGQTRVISVAEERQFIQDYKHLDATKKTIGNQEVTAESNPIAFAFAKKFKHLSASVRGSKIKKIRAKILKEQEKERAAIAAAAAIAPLASTGADDDEEIY